MTLDIVNAGNEKVGSIEVSDELFGGRVKVDLIWQSVVREHAARRRCTHATKTRARVSGSGRKPWRQKGTGRARVGEIRNPLWRKGGTVFGPQPRSYAQALPKKMVRGALVEALAAKFQQGAITVIDRLPEVTRTRDAMEMFERLGVSRGGLVVDVKPAESIERALRNLPGVRSVASGRLTARDVAGAARIVATQASIERLQEVLGS